MRQSQGAITIFHLIPFYALMFGMCCGLVIGAKFGRNYALDGGIVGGVLGFFCWKIPIEWLLKWFNRKQNLSHKTTEELRTMLHDPHCEFPNLVLLELGIKGEKMERHLPVILDLLTSPLPERRRRAWLAFVSIFPERAKLISDYHWDDSDEGCKEKVQKNLPIKL